MKKAATRRIHLFLIAVTATFAVVGYKLFVLGYTQHSHYVRTAEAQTERSASILARGGIFFTDKQGATHLAATTTKFPVTYLVPSRIPEQDARDLAARLSAIIGVDAASLEETIRTRKENMRTVGPRLTDAQVEQVERIESRGVGITYEADRFYPNGTMAADVLGFLGYEGDLRRGQYGVEGFFDDELSGRDTALQAVRSLNPWAMVRNAFTSYTGETPSIPHPRSVVLTLDTNIQEVVEERLDAAMQRLSASGGSIIVQDPVTGRILAMADRPSFDPNAYGKAKPEAFLNSTSQAIFEPGSSLKPFTMAAGLEARKITPQTTYNDPGVVEVGGFPIRNYDEKAHGVNTMTQVLEKSLNTGTMFVENLVGDEAFRNFMINMGFGQHTGVDLPGEVNGDITNLYSGRKINYLTASFGQGIAVTPLQLITAYSTIANGGTLMRPYVVEKIIEENGKETITQPEVAGIPFSSRTAAALQTMLTSVVDNGFDKARIAGYDVAGKTGTAQIADPSGGYLENEFIHSFAGFAPAHDAKFVVLIKIDKPQGVRFAADSLSPVFREIASFLLQYYNVPPSR